MSAWRRFGPGDEAQQTRVTTGTFPLESYADRDGYRSDFIDKANLSLPGVGAWADDLIVVRPEARVTHRPDHVIAYRHFSVVMCRSRGLPLYSAVNIDGSQSDRAVERTDLWRRDPRIDPAFQNLNEGYGHAGQGFFARGHMTRREDPNWGSREIAEQADADTFHITNVAPQQQSFNAGMWLRLEGYVLENTDRENMKVSVFTGPVLRIDDPVYYNRAIPVEFWKIIAFIDSRTRELTTIGYRRSQVASLPRLARERFVFGDFEDCQVSIESLAQDTGLDFGDLAQFDVMAGSDPRIELRLKSESDLYLRR